MKANIDISKCVVRVTEEDREEIRGVFSPGFAKIFGRMSVRKELAQTSETEGEITHLEKANRADSVRATKVASAVSIATEKDPAIARRMSEMCPGWDSGTRFDPKKYRDLAHFTLTGRAEGSETECFEKIFQIAFSDSEGYVSRETLEIVCKQFRIARDPKERHNQQAGYRNNLKTYGIMLYKESLGLCLFEAVRAGRTVLGIRLTPKGRRYLGPVCGAK